MQIRLTPRPVEVPDEGLVCDILWSDPDEVIRYYTPFFRVGKPVNMGKGAKVFPGPTTFSGPRRVRLRSKILKTVFHVLFWTLNMHNIKSIFGRGSCTGSTDGAELMTLPSPLVR